MGVLGPCSPKLLCGNTFTTLEVFRASGDRNSFGEVVLSFSSIGSISIDLQPGRSSVSRNIHGQLVEVAYDGVVAGNPDLSEFDRAYVSNALIEIIEVSRYGDHAEIQWKWVR
jgi:hypothetical protein